MSSAQLSLGLPHLASTYIEDLIEEHSHGFAMCVHPDDPSRWHMACAYGDCPLPHMHFEAMKLIACAYCGSPLHYAIHCADAFADDIPVH